MCHSLHTQIVSWAPGRGRGRRRDDVGLQYQQHRASSPSAVGIAPRHTNRGPPRTPAARDVHARARAAEGEHERLALRGGVEGEQAGTDDNQLRACARRPARARDTSGPRACHAHPGALNVFDGLPRRACLATSPLPLLLGSAAPRAGTRTGIVAR
jgi:hypothetical protein